MSEGVAFAASGPAGELKRALYDVIDPELGYNIVDLGLIYGVEVEAAHVHITMTMTTPGCPAADYIEHGVRQRVEAVPGIEGVDVSVIWEPPWSPDMMSQEAKRHFGFH